MSASQLSSDFTIHEKWLEIYLWQIMRSNSNHSNPLALCTQGYTFCFYGFFNWQRFHSLFCQHHSREIYSLLSYSPSKWTLSHNELKVRSITFSHVQDEVIKREFITSSSNVYGCFFEMKFKQHLVIWNTDITKQLLFLLISSNDQEHVLLRTLGIMVLHIFLYK